MSPVISVAIAAHLNQNNAFGAMTFDIAGFCSSGILGILGICTKLKYHNNPIHIIPERTCNHLKKKRIVIGIKC